MYYKVGKYLAMNYDVVVMEDIGVNQLVGKASRRLRMRLHDVGFHELRSIIQWQLTKHGKELRLVYPALTFKTCSRCGYINHELTLEDRVFKCPRCGLVIDRDLNAALNILKRGGWEPARQPVEPRPIPLEHVLQGQGEAMKQETLPSKAG